MLTMQRANGIAESALSFAKALGNREKQLEIMMVLAKIHAHPDLPAPADMPAPTAALHYLTQALEIASTITGYNVQPELIDQLALAYANAGQYQAAYESTVAAQAARDKMHTVEVQKRAMAIQSRQGIEQAQGV